MHHATQLWQQRPAAEALLGFTEHRWLVAIRRGFLQVLPLIMLGACAHICAAISLPSWQAAMQALLGLSWHEQILLLWQASFGVMSLWLLISISHTLAELVPRRNQDPDTNPISVVLVSLVCYMLLVMPGNGQISLEELGARGSFVAICTALLASELFIALRRLRALQVRWISDLDPLLPDVVHNILPAILTAALFFLLHTALAELDTPIERLFDKQLFALFSSLESDLLRAMLYSLISQILWFFGMHGTLMLQDVARNWFTPATHANELAVSLGAAPYEIFTEPVIRSFVLIGGSGATAGLLLALFLSTRHRNSRNIGSLALLPSLFNINEILLFGLPVVLNPLLLIPFVLTPIVLTLVSYVALSSGWVPLSVHSQAWVLPLGINAWEASNGWRGLALQAVNILISAGLYLPFLRRFEARLDAAGKASFRQLIHSLEESLSSSRQLLVNRQDAVGRLARQLLLDLERDLTNGAIYMVYQPKLNAQGAVVGVEALLRWQHAVFGMVPPNVLVGIAEDAGCISRIGHWTIAVACRQLASWQAAGITKVSMAVNVSPLQLSDPQLLVNVRENLGRYGLHPGDLELEITESRSVSNDEQSNRSLSALNELGVSLAMDDFGMGYSSLLYMRRFRIDTIKLDGSLTREVESNSSCCDIISQVAQLCQTMNVRVVAEYVETESQRALLQKLGCTEFQGYLYSPPLRAADCLQFIEQRARSAGQHAA
ncbi:EAL domain-containing protein [Uliginosibacterium sediminicola]|uniref:EAL domain-containing protein n=1 Tax=Uliginosibacterium sediminicola TaxID=2024550 RepID=A0ABU9Z1L9_9RHOO